MGESTKVEVVGLEELKKVYAGKKVLVTGHTGFKGAWLLLLLNQLGARIRGYSLAPRNSNDLYHLIQGDALCDSVIADVRNKEQLEAALIDFQPDFVFHMAAQALVLESYAHPAETYETNVMGTVNVLDAVRQLEQPCKVIVITTDKVYENQERLEPYREDERLGGFDPYSNSKACAELVSSSYRLSFFHPDRYAEHYKSIATARSGNVIGGGDWSEHRIIPDLAKSLRSNQPLIVRNPKAVRPWQHVLDPLNGYLTLGAQMEADPVKFASGFNFGPEDEDTLTVEQLVQIAIEQWGSGTYEAVPLDNQPHEANLLRLSIKKAKQELGWQPNLRSQEAIALTIDWYKNYENDPITYTELQIKNFYSRA